MYSIYPAASVLLSAITGTLQTAAECAAARIKPDKARFLFKKHILDCQRLTSHSHYEFDVYIKFYRTIFTITIADDSRARPKMLYM
jgi:hypothetical protein